MNLEDMRFSLTELLSLVGLAQAISVLVYMAFRAGDRRAALLPFLYFLFLASAFLLDFAARPIGRSFPAYALAQWFFWFSGPPLSVLLILQIARSGKIPDAREWGVLLSVPLAFALAAGLSSLTGVCETGQSCHPLQDWLPVTGLMAGLAGMTLLWPRRNLLTEIARQKGGSERYWIILTLIIVNLFFLGFSLVAGLAPGAGQAMPVRTVVGIALVYLAGTSLFRIYPQTVAIRAPAAKAPALSESEQVLSGKIRDLMDVQKIYQEPTCSRTSIAQELNVAESTVSKVVSGTYGCTLPHLISARRVEDAKNLLESTDAPIKIVCEEVGFNSVNSFNRVFREMTGQNPSDYRQSKRAASA